MRALCIGAPGSAHLLGGISPLQARQGELLVEGKGGTARDCLEEAGAQSDEPSNRNSIQSRVSG